MIDYSGFAFPKGQPRVLERHAKKVAKESAERDAYVLVDARDGGKSVLSGRPTTSGAVMPQMRREHHHLLPRSTHPELAHDAENIITITAEEHALIHAGALVVEGTPKGRVIGHWNRALVPAGKEPFHLLSKRKSQRRTT